MLPNAVPKPPKSKPKVRVSLKHGKPLQRTRMKSRGPRMKKSGGAAFPKVKNPAYRTWIRSLDCLLAGCRTAVQISPFDRRWWGDQWFHVCFGRIQCAHVNETQARGAADVGECVPLCGAAHHALDQRLGPAKFAQVTELNLTHIAAGLAQTYVERGGIPEHL